MNRKIRNFALFFISIGLIVILLYSLTAGKAIWILQSFAIFFFIAGASFVGGGLAGFIFGIPKTVVTRNAESITYTPNTNLEEVSDWLTKVLLGVGLTQMGEILDFINKVAKYAATNLVALGDESVFIACVILYFLVCGFISGYLGTRIILPNVFNQSDYAEEEEEMRLESQLDDEKAVLSADSDKKIPAVSKVATSAAASAKTPPKKST